MQIVYVSYWVYEIKFGIKINRTDREEGGGCEVYKSGLKKFCIPYTCIPVQGSHYGAWYDARIGTPIFTPEIKL